MTQRRATRTIIRRVWWVVAFLVIAVCGCAYTLVHNGAVNESEADKVEELFLWAFARKPTPEQRDLAMAHLAKHAANKKVAYENILWALLNTKEFVFNE